MRTRTFIAALAFLLMASAIAYGQAVSTVTLSRSRTSATGL
jgi:hypothetical protein